jgi:flagellar biosynthesis/type III secretory pathway ATPase
MFGEFMKEYKTITEIAGPLVVVSDVSGVAYGEIVEIILPSGEKRKGQVLDVSQKIAVIQVFGPTAGINTTHTTVRFLGETMRIGLSTDMLGRIFNGLGEPKDKGSKVIAKEKVDINGLPINPYSRELPNEFIQTGISTIDGMNTLVRGQKLPIFSGASLVRMSLRGKLSPLNQEGLKEKLKSNITQIKNIKERLISTDQVVYEIDTTSSSKELAQKILDLKIQGFQLNKLGETDKEISFQITGG